MKDTGKQKCAAQAQKQLKVLYSSRYDVPSTHHIQTYMNSMIKAISNAQKAENSKKNISEDDFTEAAKKNSKNHASTVSTATKTRYKMPVLYAQTLYELVQSKPTFALRDIEKDLLLKLGMT